MTTTLSLTEFLLARYAEDEEWAKTAGDAYLRQHGLAAWLSEPPTPGLFSRVLADLEAKRQIVAMWQKANANREGTSDIESVLDDVLRLLATPYADHPDYREEWKP
jgi:hypothetical protein